MNRTVYLIGIDHKYQHNSVFYRKLPVGAIEAFEDYISTVCSKNGIEAIGEDFHQSDLKKDRKMSTTKKIAIKLKKCHKYCSLSDEEALKLGWQPTLSQRRGESADKFDERDWQNDKIREKGWVQNILALNKWPLLFICGSKHISSFSELLENSSIRVHIIHENWEHNE